jgi:hypothetical protein
MRNDPPHSFVIKVERHPVAARQFAQRSSGFFSAVSRLRPWAVAYVDLHEVLMRKRSAVMWFLTLVTTVGTACGGGPTSPAPVQPLPFRAGGYLLNLGAASVDCNDERLPKVGTLLAVEVTLSVESGEWIGRPTTPDGGNFQLRFRGTSGPQSLAKSSMTGTFSGGAIDSFSATDYLPATGTRADFNPPGSVSGDVLPGGLVPLTDISSPVTFSRNSRSVTCPAGTVKWLMTPWLR